MLVLLGKSITLQNSTMQLIIYSISSDSAAREIHLISQEKFSYMYVRNKITNNSSNCPVKQSGHSICTALGIVRVSLLVTQLIGAATCTSRWAVIFRGTVTFGVQQEGKKLIALSGKLLLLELYSTSKSLCLQILSTVETHLMATSLYSHIILA